MNNIINNIKDNVIHGCQYIAELGKGAGEQIVTFDRSSQKFGVTPADQLKGRDRIRTKNIVLVALAIIMLAASIYGSVMHQGGMAYFLTGYAGLSTLIFLKEIVLQSIARAKEKKEYKIENETPEMQYSFQELVDECTQDVSSLINRLLGRTPPNVDPINS